MLNHRLNPACTIRHLIGQRVSLIPLTRVLGAFAGGSTVERGRLWDTSKRTLHRADVLYFQVFTVLRAPHSSPADGGAIPLATESYHIQPLVLEFNWPTDEYTVVETRSSLALIVSPVRCQGFGTHGQRATTLFFVRACSYTDGV